MEKHQDASLCTSDVKCPAHICPQGDAATHGFGQQNEGRPQLAARTNSPANFPGFHISCDHASSFKRFQGETTKNMFLATSGCSEGRQEEDIGLSCLGAIIPQRACGT